MIDKCSIDEPFYSVWQARKALENAKKYTMAKGTLAQIELALNQLNKAIIGIEENYRGLLK